MKKLTALILALTMLFTLATCNRQAEPEVTEEQTEELAEEIPETAKVVAGVFWYDFTDAYLSNVREALDADLTEAGITFTNYNAENSQGTQNEQIDEAIANGVNLLIVNFVDTAATDVAQSICDKAKEADIPIIFFDREVDDSVIVTYENACFVGTRYGEALEKSGMMAGTYICENYNDVDLNGDGIITYILMAGESGSQETPIDRRADIIIPDSCNAVLTEAGYPELEYYDLNNQDKYQPFNWFKQAAYELMQTALSTNPMDGEHPVEVVFGNNDDAALGCIYALNEVGWNTGDDPSKTIPVFGKDYTAEAQAAIEAGKMTGSILQSSERMAETITALVGNVQSGKNVFDGVIENYDVDDGVNKIRVPYEIKDR